MLRNDSDKKTIKALKRALKEKDKIIHRYEVLYGEIDVSDEDQMIIKLARLKEEYEELIREVKKQQNVYKELNEERASINSEIRKIIEDAAKMDEERR